MTIPKINSAHGSDTRNIINAAIDLINAQGKSIQDLVAEGQLTPSQYAQLISIVNDNVKKGSITTADIDKNNFAIDQTMITDSLRRIITGNAPINAVPANNSLTTEKYVDDSVTKRKKTIGGETATILSWNKLPDIDLVNKKMTFYSDTAIVYSKGRDVLQTDISVDFLPGRTSIFLYNTSTNTFRSTASSNSNTLTEDEVFVAQIGFKNTLQNELINVVGSMEYTVNGKNRIIKDSVHGDEIEDGAVSTLKTNFIEVSNLFNKNGEITSGKYVDTSTGIIRDSEPQNMTGIIPIEPNTTLGLKRLGGIIFYDENKNFISGWSIPTGFRTTTTPPNAKYMSFNVNSQSIEEAMAIYGDVEKPYAPHGIKILGHDITGNDKKEEELINIFPPENFEAEFKGSDINYADLSLDEINSGFTELVNNYPNYISRKNHGKDDTGEYDVYEYSLKPKEFNYNDNNEFAGKLPKVVFVANSHGFERTTAMSAYYMTKLLCENWRDNPTIDYLRHNVEFVFIAVGNPWGYVNSTYKNGNNLNIYTSFPTFWLKTEPENTIYSGEEPLTAVESQYIDTMLRENTDALFYLDVHSSSFGDKGIFYTMQPSNPAHYNPIIEESMKYAIGKTTRELIKNYPIESEDLLGHYYNRPGNGTAETYAASLGIPSYILELYYRMPYESTNYSNDAIKSCTEVFANHILSTLKTFKERM